MKPEWLTWIEENMPEGLQNHMQAEQDWEKQWRQIKDAAIGGAMVCNSLRQVLRKYSEELGNMLTVEEAIDFINEAQTAMCECCMCRGSGVIDSGGFEPWGASINIPCPYCENMRDV